MKRKNHIILILLIVILLIISGCKQKIEEKIGEKISEKVLESSTGADVDIDKDITTVKTEQVTTQMGTNIKWPKDKMNDLKELKANITMLSEDKDNEITYIMFDGLEKDDAEKYVESIKELGYKSVYEVTSADASIYVGNNENGFEVNFSYYNDGTGSLSLAKSTITEVDTFNATASPDNLFTGVDPSTGAGGIPNEGTSETDPPEEIDMTDDVPWPKDFFEEIPELEGKITGLNSYGDSEKDLYIEYVLKEEAADFINKVKEAGFVEEASESTSNDYIEYQAYNADEDYIIIVWNSDNSASISMTKSE